MWLIRCQNSCRSFTWYRIWYSKKWQLARMWVHTILYHSRKMDSQRNLISNNEFKKGIGNHGKKSWATSKEVCLLWRWQTIIPPVHCVKYRNFTQFRGVEILWKGTVSRQFRVNRPKLSRNCVFPQNFHTRNLGKITVFYAVIVKR